MEPWRRNLYVTWFTQILSLAGFGFMLPFMPFFIQEIGVTDPDAIRRWTGITASITAITMGAVAPLWGILADRFGRKLMILRSMGSGAIILFAMSFVRSIEGMVILRLIQGLLTGTITAAATLIAAGTPTEKLGFALGFLSSSTFIGISIGPLIGGIVGEFAGYRVAFRIGAAILVGAFVMVLVVIRDVRVHARYTKKKRTRRVDPEVRMVFTLVFVMIFAIRFTRSLPVSFVPLRIQEILGTIEGASVITGVISSLVGLATAVAGLTIARLGDRIDKISLIARLLVVSALLSFPIFFTRGIIGFALFYVLAALGVGGVEPMIQSIVSEHTTPERRGSTFGLLTLTGSFGWFSAPLVASAISIGAGIRWIYLAFALCLGGGAMIVFLSRFLIRRFRASERTR